MRNFCCTCGAGWTTKAFAWDEYINPGLQPVVTVCVLGVLERWRRGGDAASPTFARVMEWCLWEAAC